ncbi:MAG: DUF4214 domain-containing protein, partial [Lachnospiraceae bacterium]|nr:DUF4214 domain-containing protein [Lachnospiraceae bacterium]
MYFCNKSKRKYISTFLCAALTVTALVYVPLNVEAKNGDTGSTSLKVDYHTKEEIAEYIKNHPDDNADNNNFAVVPDFNAPYSPGRLSDSTLNDTCAILNYYRYLVGIPEVTLNDNYTESAQTACFVNAVNKTNLRDLSIQPLGMDDAMYQKGCEGADNSLMSRGVGFGGNNYLSLNHIEYTPGYSLRNIWVKNFFDIRYLFNPYMAQTGFGVVKNGEYTYSAMYSADESNPNGKNYSMVAWPAQNTPTGDFWGKEEWYLFIDDDIQSATVTMECENTGEKWIFSSESSNNSGDFYIDNRWYGLKGCIAFKPADSINCDDGASYKIFVSAKGSKQYSIEYTVDFFSYTDYLSNEDVKAFVKRFYKEVLGRPQAQIDSDTAGINNWTEALLSGSQSGAEVAYGFVNSTEFKNRDLNNDQFVNTMYMSFFDRQPDAEGYDKWYSALQNGSMTRLQVFEGFTRSQEFKNLCAAYGINPGTYTAPAKPQDPALKPLNVETKGVNENQLNAFVERLYDKALERPSDAGGKAYWKGCILNGKDDQGREYDIRTVISKGFLNSQEYKNRDRNNAEFVLDCYAAFFDRNPVGTEDEPNYWNWVQQLNNGLSR